jgi:hypothetical protein
MSWPMPIIPGRYLTSMCKSAVLVSFRTHKFFGDLIASTSYTGPAQGGPLTHFCHETSSGTMDGVMEVGPRTGTMRSSLDDVPLYLAAFESSPAFPTYSMSRMLVHFVTIPLSRACPGRGECWSTASFLSEGGPLGAMAVPVFLCFKIGVCT